MLMSESAGFGDLDYALDALGALDGRKRKGGLIGKRLAIGKKVLMYATPPGRLFMAVKYGKKKLAKRRKKKADGSVVDEVVDVESGEVVEEVPAGQAVPGGEVSPDGAPLPAPEAAPEEGAPVAEPVPEVAPTATGSAREAPAPAAPPEAEEGEAAEEGEEEGEEGEAPAKKAPLKAAPAVPAEPGGPVPLKAAPAIAGPFPIMPLLILGGIAVGAVVYFRMRKKKTAAPAGAQ